MPFDKLSSLHRQKLVGDPFHGIIRNGLIELPNASTKSSLQPEDGSVKLIGAPGFSDPVRTPEETAFDTANGLQWKGAVPLSGADNVLYGKRIGSLAAISKFRSIYVDPAGDRWLLEWFQTGSGASLRLNGRIVSRFGEFKTDQTTAPPPLNLDILTSFDPAADAGDPADVGADFLTLHFKPVEQNSDGTRVLLFVSKNFSVTPPIGGIIEIVLWVTEVTVSGTGGPLGLGITASATVIRDEAANFNDTGTVVNSDTLQAKEQDIDFSGGTNESFTPAPGFPTCGTAILDCDNNHTRSLKNLVGSPGLTEYWNGAKETERVIDITQHVYYDEADALVDVNFKLTETLASTVTTTTFSWIGDWDLHAETLFINDGLSCVLSTHTRDQDQDFQFDSNNSIDLCGEWKAETQFNGVTDRTLIALWERTESEVTAITGLTSTSDSSNPGATTCCAALGASAGCNVQSIKWNTTAADAIITSNLTTQTFTEKMTVDGVVLSDETDFNTFGTGSAFAPSTALVEFWTLLNQVDIEFLPRIHSNRVYGSDISIEMANSIFGSPGPSPTTPGVLLTTQLYDAVADGSQITGQLATDFSTVDPYAAPPTVIHDETTAVGFV